MRIRTLNWMQLEDYLSRDDRIVLPVGSTEQHAYLSLETDNILAERVAVEAAEPLGVPVLPVLAYGITPNFAAYPGSPSLRLETFAAVVRDLLNSLYGQGFRRLLVVNGHGGNVPGRTTAAEWLAAHDDAQGIWHDWWASSRVQATARGIDPDLGHASWYENFPWTRLGGVDLPAEKKPAVEFGSAHPKEIRAALGDGNFGPLRTVGRGHGARVARRRGRGARVARERLALLARQSSAR
jgi:creatinine amidohydrolase